MTNLGILDQNLLCFDNLVIRNAYLAAAITTGYFWLLNVSTFDDRCILSCNFYGFANDEKTVNALLDHICMELEALA
jgi:NRPS condensation-like uncharacterized protein